MAVEGRRREFPLICGHADVATSASEDAAVPSLPPRAASRAINERLRLLSLSHRERNMPERLSQLVHAAGCPRAVTVWAQQVAPVHASVRGAQKTGDLGRLIGFAVSLWQYIRSAHYVDQSW